MSVPTHIVTVLTPDRRGIIHRLVETLGQLDVPHVEISQTVVRGAFTIALVLSVPPARDPTTVRDALLAALGTGASASLLALDPAPAPSAARAQRATDDSRYLLTAIGDGVSGVVRELTRLVGEHEGNLTDFSSQVIDGRLQLLAEVELPAGVGAGALQDALREASADRALTVRLQHQRLFAATNEIAFRRQAT